MEVAYKRLERENSSLTKELSEMSKLKQEVLNGLGLKEEKYRLEGEVVRLKASISDNTQLEEEKSQLLREISQLKANLSQSVNNEEWSKQRATLQEEL